MARQTTLFVASIAAGLWATTPAEAATCAQLLNAGGKIVDTYVMDFGPSDKLYVYIVRTKNGQAEKCTSERPLTGRGGRRSDR